ncbi:quinone oxidoreductase [Saxophila tyrrhenica]|uniref:Quinone oxidoreductase n=1 Tax=Saxophila tyrrhenica TaxID=1690608 RepID=A0AAV9PN43_9PEZI|nr:quinone oxidoreductase [Saxophila tyrrhenica]
MVKARQWLLNQKPENMPELDGDNATFKLVEKDLPDPKDDEVLVKLTYLSNDPAQRGWISKYINPERLYTAPVKEGTPMHARGLAEVVESKSPSFKKGDTVIASTGWSEYAVLPAQQLQPAPDLPGGMGKTHYLGALGLTGLTAYFGLTEVVNTTKDDVVVVSGAAGATGMMAVQISKNILGCKKVIGMAGSDEKCKWVESLGADLCLNYKKDSFKQDLEKALPGPDGFANVYFDNVGGEITDFMLTRMAKFGRVSCCGAISNYNNAAGTKPMGKTLPCLRHWLTLLPFCLQVTWASLFSTVSTVAVLPLSWEHLANLRSKDMDKYGEASDIFKKALKDGKLKIDEGEHIVKGGFEDIPKTWMQLFSGANTGKLVTAVQ